MNRCDEFQSILLEHLYGLVEPDDALALDRHLAGCPACRDALMRAEEQQKLLASAAKLQFAEVSFQPPADERPAVVKFPGRSTAWRLLAVAAGIILLIAGVTIPGGFTSHQRDLMEQSRARLGAIKNEADQLDKEFQDRLARADKDLKDTEQKFQSVSQEMNQTLAAVTNELRDPKRLHVALAGPKSPEAGAPNRYRVMTSGGQAQLAMRVLDERKQVVYRQEKIVGQGNHEFVLPPTLPLKPNTALTLELSARGADGAEEKLSETLRLIAPLYLTHLATDKPMYQPGETVRFRSLTLERFSLRPPREDDLQLIVSVTKPGGQEEPLATARDWAVNERGEKVMGPDGQPIRGIGAGEYRLDASAPGGEYTLKVQEAQNRFPPQERKFLVNEYQKPRLNKEVEFTRRSYGPGEAVTAACKVTRAEDGNKPAEGIKVSATLDVDGLKRPATNAELSTDATGTTDLRFALPERIVRGDASLTVTFRDGGSTETVVRPVPVVLKKLQVEFFPEGGDLVAGVPNRIYFQSKTTLGKPAELKGRVLDEQGKAVASVQTFNDPARPSANQGVGQFEFTPQAGKKYRLQVDEPAGIEAVIDAFAKAGGGLPEVKPDGVVLSIPTGVTSDKDAIRVVLRSARKDRKLLVGAYCRGRLMAEGRCEAKAGEATEVVLKPEAGVGGVYRVTVFEETEPGQAVAKAERLIYRAPAQYLNLAARADKEHYTPGEKVKIGLEATNEKHEPTPAILMVAVVDRSVLKLADDKTVKQLPTQFLLTTEVRKPEDLEDADFLLSDGPQAATALDLLLGTQGWRRFAEQDAVQFQNRNRMEPDRVAFAHDQVQTFHVNFDQQKIDKVSQDYAARLASLQAALTKAEQNRQEVRNDPGPRSRREALEGETVAVRQRYDDAAAALNRYHEFGDAMRQWLLPTLIGVLLLGLLVSVARRVNLPQALPYAVATACTVAAIGFVASLQLGGAGNGPLTVQLGDPVWKKLPPDTQVAVLENADRGPLAPPMPPRMGAGGMHLMRGDRPAVAQPRMAQAMRLMGKQELAAPLAKRRMADKKDQMAAELPARDQAEMSGFMVREYAHQQQTGPGRERSDFAETLYWHPALVVPNGKAEVLFDLCDSVTTFQVLAAGHTPDGRLGAAMTAISSRLPLTLEPKVPVEVTAGDKIDVPLAVANNTATEQTVHVEINSDNLTLVQGKVKDDVKLSAGQRGRLVYRFQPSIIEGEARLAFDGHGDLAVSDRIARSFRVVPEGFPVVGSASDVLEKVARQEVVLPNDMLPGTLRCQATVYPSTLADIQKGLDALLQEPNGCFEQTSSSNYPNLLVLNYLKESEQKNPEATRRAQELLRRGYEKLVSFECVDPAKDRRQGYEWFGGTAPAHEALTAYGLLQFRDMAGVFDVDQKMVERTRQYLMGQKDGKGGFKRNPRALDSFGQAPEPVTNAYIVWSLTESGKDDDVAKELAVLREQAQTSKDPYFLALVANSLLNRSETEAGLALLKRLVAAQQADGHLDGSETSITGSRGRDLQVETTALTVLAWLKAQRPEQFTAPAQRAVKWLGQQRGGQGSFGATQATILALKALIAYAKANKRPIEEGDVVLYVGNQEIARQHFSSKAAEVIELRVPDAERRLHGGKNEIRLEITGKNTFPYTLTWSYRTRTPLSAEGCPVRLQARLDRTEAKEGETVRLTATVENVSGRGQGMAVAILGLPAGLSLPEDVKQLKDMARLRNNGKEAAQISFWEIRGRELVLYFRDMAPEKRVEIPLDLVCRVPGQYAGPASRAYLYYDADHKCWAEPLKLHISAD